MNDPEPQLKSAPLDILIIRPKARLLDLQLKDVWQYRELLYFLAWRDLKVRYKQTVVGIGWNILSPLLTMAIFTVVFSYFAKVPSEGVPYPVFSFTALLPWQVFAKVFSSSSGSLISNSNLLSKIYFPRLIIPLASTAVPMVDFAVSFVILLIMIVITGVEVTVVRILLLPLFLLLAVASALAIGLWLAALYVRYRDIGQMIPFMLQFWTYASPIAYPVSLVPEQWRFLYSLNPMVGVITGFRWALLDSPAPDILPLLFSVVVVVLLLSGGVVYFKRTESIFADVV